MQHPSDSDAEQRPTKPGQHVIISLRRMIAEGVIQPGERIAEVATAAALGVSRMPVRTALRALEAEGLVTKLGGRGYAARAITASEIHGAIEVRGVLEGLAARRIAAQGLSSLDEQRFAACLAQGEAIFAKGDLVDGDLDCFYAYNLAFHDLLIEVSGNPSIGQALARNNHLPFASASALAIDWSDRPAEFAHLLAAHRAHCAVVDAILRQAPDEAERVMRNHAEAAVGSASVFRRLGIGPSASAAG